MRDIAIPRGGDLLLFIVPLVLVMGLFGIGWLSYWLPRTTLANMAPYIVIGALFLEALVVSVLIFFVLPGYVRFTKHAKDAVEITALKGERYAHALLGSALGYWEYDLTKNELFLSGHLMAMLGYADREKVETMDFLWANAHPEDVEGLKRTVEYNFDRRAEPYSIAYRIRRQNGEYMWVEDRGKTILDDKGVPLKMAGITQDITNIRRVQEVLESRTLELEDAKSKIEEEIQNVRKFQKAVDSSAEAVSITTPDGAIVYVNPAWVRLNGYTDVEVMGRSHRLLKSDNMKPDLFVGMWEKISAGYPFHTEEVINKRKDGTLYQCELSIAPIREGNETLFYVALCQDITLRKEVDRAKTEFVSLASHQLRTPLSAIRWYSEMLLSKYVGELNEKQRQYVKEIYAGNLRMVELVNALLNVSRIDLGTFAVDPEPVSLVEICESVLLELTPQLNERTQTVERIFTNAPATYSADPKLIRIVFQNFLSNSVKYTQPGGHIIAEITTQGNDLYIRVSDNGYGIPKAQQGKIFEKLFRADNVRQKDTEGTGLGMYIVKAIVESSNGKIWFDSDENQGTTFHVTLPMTGMTKKSGMRGLN